MGEALYLERIVWFHSQIQKGRYPNATSLAERFECDRKTAQRTIDFFRDRLGAPLQYDPSRRGYTLTDPDYQFPATRITETELLALLASRRLLDDARAGTLGDDIAKVSERLGSILSTALPTQTRPETLFSFRWSGMTATDPSIFTTVITALVTTRPITICYRSPRSATCTTRIVEPHHLQNYMGSWHLIAWCRLRNDWRDFHLARMTDLTIGPDPFTPRDESQWRPLLDDTFGIFQNRERFDVTLRFTPERARWVGEEIWHHNQRVTILPSGGLEMTIPVSHEAEILMQILRHGSHVEVVSPDWLRRRVRDEIARMMERYGG